MTSNQDPYRREERAARLVRSVAGRQRPPDELVARLAALRQGRRARRTAPRWTLAVPAAVLAAAVVVVLVTSLSGGGRPGAGSPTPAQVVALAGAGPAGRAPAVDVSAPSRLSVAVGGLHFPNWARDGGWRATGQRVDRLRGREVRTVFYSRGDERLAYSIVAPPALVAVGGVGHYGDRYLVARRGGRTAVIWTVAEHTCVLSGTGISAALLWSLARSTTRV